MEEEGGFADAGVAAKEDGGARDETAAEDAVELGDGGGDSAGGLAGGEGEIGEWAGGVGGEVGFGEEG